MGKNKEQGTDPDQGQDDKAMPCSPDSDDMRESVNIVRPVIPKNPKRPPTGGDDQDDDR